MGWWMGGLWVTMQDQCKTRAQPWQNHRRTKTQTYQTNAKPEHYHSKTIAVRQTRFVAELGGSNSDRICNRGFYNVGTSMHIKFRQWPQSPMATEAHGHAYMTVVFQSPGAADLQGTCPALGVEH